MLIVNIREAKAHLSHLIEKAARGESFIITKAGKAMVKVVALAPGDMSMQRIGFLNGRMRIPADFDNFGKKEIARLFSDEA